jgi:DnaJ-class molecular chaperone
LKKDFYRILGINQEADPAKIKEAYRRAAKRYHPDISPKDEERFRQVQAAYETLSDPKKKAVYDEQSTKQPVHDVRSYPLPHLTPSSFPIFDEIERIFSDLDSFWNDEEISFPRIFREDRGDLNLEVILSPEEAAIGCEIPIEIPYSRGCSRCHGTGWVGNLICGFCRSEGRENLKKEIEIRIPSGVRSGMVMKSRINLDGKGRDLFITVKVQSF